jgi:hypothetical protein
VQPPLKSAAGLVRLRPPFAGDVLAAAASFKSIAEYKRLWFSFADEVLTAAAYLSSVAGLVECMVRPLPVVCHGCKVQPLICCCSVFKL